MEWYWILALCVYVAVSSALFVVVAVFDGFNPMGGYTKKTPLWERASLVLGWPAYFALIPVIAFACWVESVIRKSDN